MKKYILVTDSLSKKFNQRKVLNNINLKIPKGCIYGLLGINGAGKSTIMKIISGIITKYDGYIYFDNKDWNRNILKRIGSLIEYPGAYDNLSACDNMKIVALEDNIPFNKISDILKKLRLSKTGKQKVKNFSLGMKQRLGIAMAMLKDPDFLILDEPFNGLDPYGIKELILYLKELSNLGKTILISSHVLPEINEVSDYVGIISNGNLVYQDSMSNTNDLQKIFFNSTQERK